MLATVFQVIVAVLFIFTALLLIGLVLLQKNRGSGLSGAFGGVGGHSAFGTRTGDFLTWVTVGMTAFFLLLAVVANYAYQPAKTAEELGISAPPVLPAATPTETAPPPTPALPAGPTPGASTPAPATPVEVAPSATQTPAAPTTAAAP